MSEQKIKVSDLPEAEQKELLAEATALNIRGVAITAWTVETLKKKIAEARQTTGAEQATETKTAETLDTVGQTEAKNTNEIPIDTKNDNESNITETLDTVGQLQDGKKTIIATKKVNGICHICRSRVIDGKCTGCGFEVKR